MEPMKATSVNSRAEELLVQLFCEAFGPEKRKSAGPVPLRGHLWMEKSSLTFQFPLVISGGSTISGRKASAILPNSMAGISLRRRIWRTSA